MRLEGSADRVTMDKACTPCVSKRHEDRGCWKRLLARSVAAKDIRRISACTCVQLVERYMTVANTLWNKIYKLIRK